MLKYILKEAEYLKEQSALIQDIRRDCRERGIEFNSYIKDIDSLFSIYSKKFVKPSVIEGLVDKTDTAERSINWSKLFSSGIELKDSSSLLQEFRSSTLSIDRFKDMICYVLNSKLIRRYNEGLGIVATQTYSVLKHLPSVELNPFSKANTQDKKEVLNPTISISRLSNLMSEPIYQNEGWESYSKKEDVIKFFFDENNSVATQTTDKTYARIASSLIDDINSEDVDTSSEEFYLRKSEDFNFKGNYELVSSGVKGVEIFDRLDDNDEYVSNFIKENESYGNKISLNELSRKVESAVNFTLKCVDLNNFIESGITYKLVLDLSKNIVFYADSIELYRAIEFLKCKGLENVEIYFDDSKGRLIIRGNNTKISRSVPTESRSGRVMYETKTVEEANYAYIEQADVSSITKTTFIQYLQFELKDYSLKDKIKIINPKTVMPLMLTKDFKREYSNLVNIYQDQKVVANSGKTSEEILEYIEDITNSYIDTYTYLKEQDGKQIRLAKPKKSWKKKDYVYRVEETYWRYNTDISVDELISFFLSKKNSVGYRYLCLKILGFDYWLFNEPLTDKLIKEGSLFVNNIDVDKDNYEVNLEYLDYNSFVSKDIYSRRDNLENEKLINNLKEYYGEDASDIIDASLKVISESIEDRFIPRINPPSTGNIDEDESLRLNIDLHCPIFYKSSAIKVMPYPEDDKILKNTSSTNYYNTTSSSTSKYGEISVLKGVSGSPSSSYISGIIKLFSDFLSNLKDDEILGNFSKEEIFDAYVIPVRKSEYIGKWIAPFYEDKDGTVVPYELHKRGSITYDFTTSNMMAYTSSDMLKVLSEKGDISSSETMTKKEAEDILTQFKLRMLERRWSCLNEGRRLFNVFLREGLDEASQKAIEETWNKEYNNYAKPVLRKQPVFINHNVLFGDRQNPFEFGLRDAQLEGLRHTTANDNSGLLLHEVGFGKTTTSITSIIQLFNTGEARRALFLVPTSVYDKFFTEIKGDKDVHGLFPDVNVVAIGNAKEKAIRSLKNPFSKREEELIDNFKKVKSTALDIIEKTLKKSRIQFDFESDYEYKSGFDFFFDLFKSEIKKYLGDYEDFDFVKNGISKLYDIYREALGLSKEKYNQIENNIFEAINNGETENEKKYRKKLEEFITGESSSLKSSISDWITILNNRLIDELGSYRDEVMSDKTILIGTHNAVQQLRPSSEAVQEAVFFKENLGEVTEAERIDRDVRQQWKSFKSGLQGFSIIEKHPISLEKLSIDAFVVDEIHNFNNIVGKSDARRFDAKPETRTRTSNPSDYKFTSLKKNARKLYRYNSTVVMDKLKGSGGGKKYAADIYYVSKWNAANKNKLNLAAISFYVQNKNKESKNVLMLSATPFTDHPYQVLSVLGMSNMDILRNSGIRSAFDFYNNYVKESYQFGVKHNQEIGLFADISGYYNSKALSNLITNIANVKITDDAIEKTRPVKAVIPQEKIDSDGDSHVTVSGNYFDELEGVSSRVSLTPIQKEIQESILEYLKDDSETRKLQDYFPSNESVASSQDLSDVESDEDLEDFIKEAKNKRKEIKKKPDNSDELDELVTELQTALIVDFPNQKDIIKLIKDIRVKDLGEDAKEVDEDMDTNEEDVDFKAVRRDKRLEAKAISCQSAQEQIVLSPYFLKVGIDGKQDYKGLPSIKSDPAKIFVENSPKLLFTVKAIQDTIKYQQGQLERGEIDKIGGQVVYFNKINFWSEGVKYNAFELLAEYLVRFTDGLSDEKFEKTGEYKDVAIIAGKSVKDESRYNKKGETIRRGKVQIKNQFNNGEIKVLLGSKSIKEGIDLQGNAHTMYICQAEFSPTVSMQLEGRIWRQKNPYDNVRIAYVLALNSIDAFIYDKLNRKISNIKTMLEQGVYDMNTTQFTMNARERLLSIITDPDLLTKIEFYQSKALVADNVNRSEKKIAMLQRVESDYEPLISNIDDLIPTLNTLVEEFRKLYNDRFRNDIYKKIKSNRKKDLKKAKNKLKSKLIDEFENMSDKDKDKYKLQESSKKGSVNAYINSKESEFKKIEDKYEPTDEEVNEAFDNSDYENPFPVLESPLTSNTPYSILEPIVRQVIIALAPAYDVEFSLAKITEKEQIEILDKGFEKDEKGIRETVIWMNTEYPQVEGREAVLEKDGDKYFKNMVLREGANSTEKYVARLAYFVLGVERMSTITSKIKFMVQPSLVGLNSYQTLNPEENRFILQTYEEHIASEGKSISDIPTMIGDIRDVIRVDIEKLKDEDMFKREIKENWLKILEDRKEVDDLSVDEVVKSFSKSNVLLKLRKN